MCKVHVSAYHNMCVYNNYIHTFFHTDASTKLQPLNSRGMYKYSVILYHQHAYMGASRIWH